MSTLRNRRLLVTGGAGFLGKYVIEALRPYHPASIEFPRKLAYDLTEQSAVRRLVYDFRPDIVIHLAALVGGIGANRANPGSFFYQNAIMGLLLMEECRLASVQKFVNIGSVCSYPKHTPVPFQESELWNGYPEQTNAAYGIAKKAIMLQGQAYRQQYQFNAITLLPVNLYGPGDNFDLESSHVIPALIRKIIQARNTYLPYIEVWGTGSATREFMYVQDAARGIVLAAENYDGEEPVNLGTGSEVSIKQLTGIICNLCGYSGEIRWDHSKPDGQPRRCLDVSRAEAEFGFRASTSFMDGLIQTIRWYESNYHLVRDHD